MSDSTPRAVSTLHALAADHALGPLRGVRLDPAVAERARTAASQVLADGSDREALAELCRPDGLGQLLDLAGRLLWSRQHAATRAVLGVAARIASLTTAQEAATVPWQEVCDGYAALTRLTESGAHGPATGEDELRRIGAGLFLAADAYLDGGDTRRCALVASAGLWVLFHQELHDAAPSSPLVSDPQGWLRPLSVSRTGQLLTAGLRSTRPDRTSPTPRTSPLVLGGAYPRFAAPVVEALRADQGLTVSSLELSTVDKPFKRMAVEPWLVELRLRAALGEPVHYEALEEQLSRADTVLADWADAGAVLASLLVAPTTTLTVRAHSVDALRCWLHLIDWTAVDQLICVGPHVQDLIREQLGERLSRTRLVVLPNIVHLGRFDHPRGEDTAHTLAMVGWARAVKDPLWTVELLARLRRHDTRWRLRLIGHSFADALPRSGREYAERFARRVQEPDVRSAIHYVPFTDNLPPVLAQVGWVVSSSMRESWGVGPMEAVAAGAVPIIRDWPFFSRWGGPRRLYPEEWVVDSLDDAEQRIAQVTAAGARATVAEGAYALLAELIDPERAAADYRRALTIFPPDERGHGSSMPA